MTQVEFRSRRGARRGFTLIEITLVVTIIMLLVGLVGPHMAGVLGTQKINATRIEINNVKTALENYDAHVGSFPSNQQGLLALVRRPAEVPENEWVKSMSKIPVDAWGHLFQYTYPATSEDRDFDLVSAGKDGKFGTPDDINNFDPPLPK